MSSRIKIIDVGLGNIASIQNMLKKIGQDSDRMLEPTVKNSDIDLLILPGVGSYDYAMKKLNSGGWTEYIKELATDKKVQVMGICLGMQLLCDGSEEGDLSGLSLVPGHFKKFSSNGGADRLKVPHMGWNTVHYNERGSWMMDGHEDDPRYYFVHSYYYTHHQPTYVAGTTGYGVEYGSAIQNGNVFGFQFHPEKSHRFGMNLLRNVIKQLC